MQTQRAHVSIVFSVRASDEPMSRLLAGRHNTNDPVLVRGVAFSFVRLGSDQWCRP